MTFRQFSLAVTTTFIRKQTQFLYPYLDTFVTCYRNVYFFNKYHCIYFYYFKARTDITKVCNEARMLALRNLHPNETFINLSIINIHMHS